MLTSFYEKTVNSQFFDDFFDYDAARWPNETVNGTGSTIGVGTAPGTVSGGWIALATGAAATDYNVLSSAKVAEFLPKLPVKAECRLKITEAAANSSSWWFGLTDTVAAGFLTGAGQPPVNYHGAVFYKPAGSNALFVQSSNGTAQVAGAQVGTYASGSAVVLTIELDPGDGTTGQVRFYINGQPDYAGNVPIKPQMIALAGFTPLAPAFGVTASTGAAETLLVDYAGVELYRP